MNTPNKRKKSGPAERSTTESGRGKTVPSKGGGGKTPSANAKTLHPLPESKGGGGKSGGGKGTSDHREAMRDVIRPRAQSWPLRC